MARRRRAKHRKGETKKVPLPPALEKEKREEPSITLTNTQALAGLGAIALLIVAAVVLTQPTPVDDKPPVILPGNDTTQDDRLEEEKLTLTVVTDSTCKVCDPAEVIGVLQQLFPKVTVNKIDYSTAEGKAIAEANGMDALPGFLLSPGAAAEPGYAQLAGAVFKRKDGIFIDSRAVGTVRYLAPPTPRNSKWVFDAPVAIVEYSDFQCPYCKRFFEQTLPQLETAYGNNATFAYKHYPLTNAHPMAQKAAEGSECAAEQGQFWKYHDLVFPQQASLSIDALKQTARAIAEQPGVKLNVTQFDQCLDSGKYQQRVEDDLREGIRYGVSGTPGFFINGIRVIGAQPFDKFKEIIDAELALAPAP